MVFKVEGLGFAPWLGHLVHGKSILDIYIYIPLRAISQSLPGFGTISNGSGSRILHYGLTQIFNQAVYRVVPDDLPHLVVAHGKAQKSRPAHLARRSRR